MAKINISEFNQPGVYTREIDGSIRQVPATTTLINLVPGFSRKGPVNSPVLISSPQQLLEVFGDIDRYLEKKGCFFHRTILNMLKTSPVWAVNLLKTDDELDLIEWASVSTASNKVNGIVRKAALSRLYDKSDFWSLDTDSFVDLAKQTSDSILHITNVGAKKSSVFLFKSNNSNFNNTLELWYSGKDNVPAYLRPSDLVSDYMVNMLVLSGDWSDYNTLSVDSRWSKYFTKNGLKKSALQSFMNDSAVTVLNYFADLSLIPYFADANGRDMFIETVVNQQTNTTGVFVGYDINAVEDADYPKGLLDLIGNNIVNANEESINYLSYKENISEVITFNKTLLNRAGNVLGGSSSALNEATTQYATLTLNLTQGGGTSLVRLVASSVTSYVLNGVLVTPSTLNNQVESPDAAANKVRKDTLYLDANGNLGIVQGQESSKSTEWNRVPTKPVPAGTLPVAIVYVGTAGASNTVAIPASTVSMTTTGTAAATSVQSIVEITNLTTTLSTAATQGDITVSYVDNNVLVVTFNNTRNSDEDVYYAKLRKNMMFNQLAAKLRSGVSIVRANNGAKVKITRYSLVTAADENKSITVSADPGVNINKGAGYELYFQDDEFSTPGGSFSSFTTDVVSGKGVVAENSELYQSYLRGDINSGDFFHPNVFNHAFNKVEFSQPAGANVVSLFYVTSNSVTAAQIFAGKEFRIVGTAGNDQVYNTVSVNEVVSGANHRLDITVAENVVPEVSVDRKVIVQDSAITVFLKLYFTNKVLNVDFSGSKDLIGTTTVNLTTHGLDSMKVFSNRSNFKQSIEVSRVLESNRILVDASRYSNLKVGDYLQAFVDVTTLEAGEVGKNLTRIIGKRLFPSDVTLIEVTTDSQINLQSFGAALMQTYRYTSMEEYVNTYTAIVLNGFKMREDSMPDGTEQRQSAILDLVGTGSPLFKALTNRNKISWRYLVDCWSLGLASDSKNQLVALAGKRLTSLAILNMPSAKDFKNCTSASFVNAKTKALEIEFIAKGGDPESNPAFQYSFGTGEGASNSAYFFPHVIVSDNSRPLLMPPASFVLNTFMNKHTSRLASVKPWTVAAGLDTGQVVGFNTVEFDINDEDLGYLTQLGANALVYKMNRGFCIENDFTAQVLPKSALSYIHVREALIELEEELYQMLLGFQYKFNTPEFRQTIKDAADEICVRYVRDGALYDFKNVMNETNNDGAIIDAGIGVIDTFVEPVKAMGIIVNNVTVLKTGDIQNSGFRSI